MGMKEWAQRGFALLVGFLLIIAALLSPAREALVLLLLMIGVVLVLAAAAGEVRFVVRVPGKAEVRVTLDRKTVPKVAKIARVGNGFLAKLRSR